MYLFHCCRQKWFKSLICYCCVQPNKKVLLRSSPLLAHIAPTVIATVSVAENVACIVFAIIVDAPRVVACLYVGFLCCCLPDCCCWFGFYSLCCSSPVAPLMLLLSYCSSHIASLIIAPLIVILSLLSSHCCTPSIWICCNWFFRT